MRYTQAPRLRLRYCGSRDATGNGEIWGITGLESYDKAKEAAAEAQAVISDLTEKLEAVVNDLTLNPIALLLLPRINYPVEDDPKRMRIEYPDPEDRTSLDNMPERRTIHAALLNLKNSKVNLEKAFDALTETEKKYVRSAEAQC